MMYSQQPCYYFPYYQPQVTSNQQETHVEQAQGLINANIPSNNTQTNYDTDELEVGKKNKSQNIKEQTKQNQEEKKKVLKAKDLFDSTNLHKNFTKALVAYAIRQQIIIYKLLGEKQGQSFLELMHSVKNKLCNLAHILQFTNNDEFLKAFRTIGLIFLNKESVSYIYNSKIQQKTSHLKHKAIIKKALLKI